MKLSKSALIMATVATLSAPVNAESLAEKIKKRAGETAEIKALLNDPDQNTRIAALDVMLKSQDTAMRELAYTTGFNSADDTFRAIALRNKFNELKSVTVYLELPENSSDDLKKVYDSRAGILILSITKYNEAVGSFASGEGSSNYKYDSSVSGLSVNFQTRQCGGTLILNDESTLEGEVACEKQKFSAKANII